MAWKNHCVEVSDKTVHSVLHCFSVLGFTQFTAFSAFAGGANLAIFSNLQRLQRLQGGANVTIYSKNSPNLHKKQCQDVAF